MILEGWPETSPLPQGPSKTYERGPQTYIRGPQTSGDDMTRADKSNMKADESRRLTIIIGELGFSSDLGFQKTVDRKQHKYAPLIEELEREGWNVRPTVHVITVEVRATVLIRNVEVLKSLGIKEKPA
jgi:hypothetical protein